MARAVMAKQVAIPAPVDRPSGALMALKASWQRRPAAPMRAAHQVSSVWTPATPGQCANQRPTPTMAGSDQLFWPATRRPASAGRSRGSKVASSDAMTRTAVAIRHSK